MIYLVRHAHAGQKQTWSGPDSRQPLSSHGQQEAAGLLIQLHQEPITRIISSPALRCQQTVWPLARQRRLAVELDRRLDVDATTAQAAAMLLDPGIGHARALHPRRTDRPALGPAPPGWIPDRHRRHLAQGIDLGAGPLPRPDHAGNLPAAAAPRPLTSHPSTLNTDDTPLPRPLTITLCREPMATTTRTTSSSPEQ